MVAVIKNATKAEGRVTYRKAYRTIGFSGYIALPTHFYEIGACIDPKYNSTLLATTVASRRVPHRV
jgi:hypothetical protein